jgi:hypothetical protein
MILAHASSAQNVAGVYKGTMEVDSPKNTINFELTLKEKKGKIYGYCYRLFIIGDTVYYNLVKVSGRISGKQLIVDDERSVSNNFDVSTRGIKTRFFFKLDDIKDTADVLPGDWMTSFWKNYQQLTGKIVVIREKDYKSTQLYSRLADVGLAEEMSFDEPATSTATIAKAENKPPAINDIKVNNKTSAAVAKKDKTKGGAVSNIQINREGKEVVIRYDLDKNAGQVGLQISENGETFRDVTAQGDIGENISSGKAKTIRYLLSDTSENKATVFRIKTDNFITDANPAKLAVMKAPAVPAAIALKGRKSEAIASQSYAVYEDSVTLSMYDNGEIDGDTVSVFVNDMQVVEKVGLTAQAYKITIPISRSQLNKIELFAENLGRIPPNTGLLVIYSGDKRYQIFFTATLEKNAVIYLERKDP